MTGRAMPARLRPLILACLLVPVLSACQDAGPAKPAPLTEAALAAVDRNPGVGREKLARAIDSLFADPAAGDTHAVVVLHEGRVIAERYGEGFNRDTRLLGWSMSKTITGLMIGQLVADGRLRLDESAPVPAWQRNGDPRGEITLRQLLQMRSGLRHVETADPVYAADTVRMLFLDGRNDMAAYAEAQPLEAEPGRQFEYSSGSSVILADLAAGALSLQRDPRARQAAVADYLRARLFEPLGMRSATPEFDAAGTFIGSSMVHATARDWGKLGEFLRNHGSYRGSQLVPRVWIDFMTRPSPRNPGYGAQLWLNRPQSDGEDVLFPGKARGDLFAAVGHLGQYVIVSPAQKLTVVRMGHSDEAERAGVRAHLAEIIALFPAG